MQPKQSTTYLNYLNYFTNKVTTVFCIPKMQYVLIIGLLATRFYKILLKRVMEFVFIINDDCGSFLRNPE